MEEQKMLKILLADDHAAIREGVEAVLTVEGMSVIGMAKDAKMARALYKKLSPDILIMDMSMPGAAGTDSIPHILQDNENAKIIIFSIHDNLELVSRALEVGASGYVTKSCSLSELINAIKEVAKGGIYVSSCLAQKLVYKNIRGKQSSISSLSEREFNIFCLVAEGKSSHEISELLFLAEKTIANYISQIKQKLELKSTVELVHMAIQHKLIKVSELY